MRISTRGRYALEALLFLTLQGEGTLMNTRAIAAGTGISAGYLEQLFIPLRGAGILEGVRGASGGNRLARSPEKLTAGEALRAVEGNLSPVSCLGEETCPDESRCRSRHTWNSLYTEIEEYVSSVTFADLAAAFRAQENPEYTL